ncbi:hypothetical protein MIMGU_mgv11b0241222mg, partial [Erythranthe guttata]
VRRTRFQLSIIRIRTRSSTPFSILQYINKLETKLRVKFDFCNQINHLIDNYCVTRRREREKMALRSVVSRSELCRLMESSWRSSASGIRYFSDGKGRVLGEEERAQETVYIQ